MSRERERDHNRGQEEREACRGRKRDNFSDGSVVSGCLEESFVKTSHTKQPNHSICRALQVSCDIEEERWVECQCLFLPDSSSFFKKSFIHVFLDKAAKGSDGKEKKRCVDGNLFFRLLPFQGHGFIEMYLKLNLK